jgi:hypothetical protein
LVANPKPDFRDVVGDEIAERIARLANDPGQDDAARKAERERAETDRLTRHTQLVDQVQFVLRGGLGRHKEAAVCIESLQRLLGATPPRQAETAILITCESIIREAKQRIRKSKRAGRAGRSAQ